MTQHVRGTFILFAGRVQAHLNATGGYFLPFISLPPPPFFFLFEVMVQKPAIFPPEVGKTSEEEDSGECV